MKPALYERIERLTAEIPLEKYVIFKTSCEAQGWHVIRCLNAGETCNLRVTVEKVVHKTQVEPTSSLSPLAKMGG